MSYDNAFISIDVALYPKDGVDTCIAPRNEDTLPISGRYKFEQGARAVVLRDHSPFDGREPTSPTCAVQNVGGSIPLIRRPQLALE